MSGTEKTVEFIPTARRKLPPTKPIEGQDGLPLYWWFVTEDEYFRLSKLFGRDFQGTGMGASAVHGLPAPAKAAANIRNSSTGSATGRALDDIHVQCPEQWPSRRRTPA